MTARRARPEAWYRLRSVGDGVTLIDEPWIREFYRCNIWHVRGRDRDLLVDSGMGVVSLPEWVPLVTERPVVAVASHTHFDHIGSHHEFADPAGAPGRGGPAGPADPGQHLGRSLRDGCDFPPPAAGPVPLPTYAVTAAPATRLLEDGDVLDLGDRRFEVIHTPGHSPGGIALWEAATGVLFSGDILYDGPLIEDTYHADPADYVRSMARLLTLPVWIVHGGHFPSFGRAHYRTLITDWLRGKGRA